MKRFIASLLSFAIAATSIMFCFPVTASAEEDTTKVDALTAANAFVTACSEYFVDNWTDEENPFVMSTFDVVSPQILSTTDNGWTSFIGLLPDSLTFNTTRGAGIEYKAVTVNKDVSIHNSNVDYTALSAYYRTPGSAPDQKSSDSVSMTSYGINPDAHDAKDTIKGTMMNDNEGIFLPYKEGQKNMHTVLGGENWASLIKHTGKETYTKHWVHGTLGVYVCRVDKSSESATYTPVYACPIYILNSKRGASDAWQENPDKIYASSASIPVGQYSYECSQLQCVPDVTWLSPLDGGPPPSDQIYKNLTSSSVCGLDILLLAQRLHEYARDASHWTKIGLDQASYDAYMKVASNCNLEDDPITLFLTVPHIKGMHNISNMGDDTHFSSVYAATSSVFNAKDKYYTFNYAITQSIVYGLRHSDRFTSKGISDDGDNAFKVISKQFGSIGESDANYPFFSNDNELASCIIGQYNSICRKIVTANGNTDFNSATSIADTIKKWYSTWMGAIGALGIHLNVQASGLNGGVASSLVISRTKSGQPIRYEACTDWETYSAIYGESSDFLLYAYYFMQDCYGFITDLTAKAPAEETEKLITDYNKQLVKDLSDAFGKTSGEIITFEEVLSFLNGYSYESADDGDFTKLQRVLYYLATCDDFTQIQQGEDGSTNRYEDFCTAIAGLREKLKITKDQAEPGYLEANNYSLFVHRIAFDHAFSIGMQNPKNVFAGAHASGGPDEARSTFNYCYYDLYDSYDKVPKVLDTVYYQDLLTSYLAIYNYDTGNGNDATQRGKTLSIRSEVLLNLANSGVRISSLRSNTAYKDIVSVLDMCDATLGETAPINKINTTNCYLSVDASKNTRPWLLIEKSGDYFYYLLELLTELNYITIQYSTDFLIIANLTDVSSYAKISESISVLDNMCSVGMNFDCSMSRTALYTPYPSFYSDADPGTKLSLMDLRTILMRMGLLTADDYSLLEGSNDQPLTYFWKLDYGSLSLNGSWLKGRALSATYIPLQSNSYDPYTMFDLMDTDWIQQYHYRWGFYRKALFLDTNTDAAQDYYVTGNKGALRVATLEDLMHPDTDIVLYIDDDLYNTQTLAELQDKTYGLYTDTEKKESEANIFAGFGYWLTHMNDVSMENIVKTDSATVYSSVVHSQVSPMEWSRYDDNGNYNYDPFKKYNDFLLTGSEIADTLTNAQEYSVMVSFAIISSIYRDADNFKKISEICSKDRPVFVSSPTLATLPTATETLQATLYNYALLKNLKGMATVGYETSIDMTSPLYMDLYGNIVCESGLVVVPAACNATLHNADMDFMPSCVGFMATYGKEWKIPGDWELDATFMEKFFKLNPDTNEWDIRPRTILGTNMNWAQLSYSSKDVQEALRDWYYYDLINANIINKELAVQCMHEVIRGAPIENIDLNMEGLGTVTIDKAGLNAAAKLDAIIDALDWDGKNSILSTPTLAFLEHYDLIVTIIFKVLLIIVVIALMITIFNDVVKQKFSWRTVGSCLLTVAIGAGSIVLIPVAFDVSYYQSNKALLQKEAEYIMMYNMEKNMAGVEVGVTHVNEYNQNTDIYLKVSSYKFEWWKNLDKVIFGDSVAIMKEEYENYLNSQFLSGYDLIQLKNDGAYVAVQDIFNTSLLNYDTITKCLYQKVSTDPVVSFYLPYYLFLDAILADMNEYNTTHDIYAYSTKIMRGGQVKTVNLCNAYFSSPEFMEGNYDYLGLIQLYGVQEQVQPDPIFDDARLESCITSAWYAGGLLDNDESVKRVDKMHHYMRQFVADNRHLIGKVTDETFIKALAMSTAIYYNNLYGVANANAYEIYNLANSDLMRLSITDKATTLETSPMSFARFAYNETGAFGTYASVFLVIVTMFTAFVKAILTVALFVLLVVSIYVQKILMRGKNHPLGGYCITLLVICSTNLLYALLLKIALLIPNLGITPSICIILEILIQLGYVFVLLCVLSFALRDWRNIGMMFYQPVINKASTFVKNKTVNNPRFNKYAAMPRGPKHIDASDFGQAGARDFAESNYGTPTLNHETRGELKRKKTGNQNLN